MIVSKPHTPTIKKPATKAKQMAIMLGDLDVGMALTITVEANEFSPNIRAVVSNAQKEFSPKRIFRTAMVSDTQIEVERTA